MFKSQTEILFRFILDIVFYTVKGWRAAPVLKPKEYKYIPNLLLHILEFLQFRLTTNATSNFKYQTCCCIFLKNVLLFLVQWTRSLHYLLMFHAIFPQVLQLHPTHQCNSFYKNTNLVLAIEMYMYTCNIKSISKYTNVFCLVYIIHFIWT